MGEEISQTLFDAATFDRFHDRLRGETDLLSDLSATQRLSEDGFVIGFEIEAWLLDHGFFPNPVNEPFLKTLSHPPVSDKGSQLSSTLKRDSSGTTSGLSSTAPNE